MIKYGQAVKGRGVVLISIKLCRLAKAGAVSKAESNIGTPAKAEGQSFKLNMQSG